MKKTREISVPSSLSDAESLMLRHIVKLKDQANQNVSEYVNYLLSTRGLTVTDWAISLADFKTLVQTKKPEPAQQ